MISNHLAGKLREQRAQMSAQADKEFRLVEECVHEWIVARDESALLGCPILNETIRRIHRLHELHLPEGWHTKIPKYCLNTSRQNAWARTSPTPHHELSEPQLKPLAKLLVQVRASRTAGRTRE